MDSYKTKATTRGYLIAALFAIDTLSYLVIGSYIAAAFEGLALAVWIAVSTVEAMGND